MSKQMIAPDTKQTIFLNVNELAQLGIAGGAVYDALIAVTALEATGTLLTRDTRAEATYQKLGLVVEMIG